MIKEEMKRLYFCMKRAERGEELTIGFLGGSITQGSFASEERLTYAWKVYEWWCRTFPRAVFHYVNGGIGGTTSHFGAARAVKDMLMYQPDVVIVDFSVNDEPTVFFQETFEGLLRRLLFWPGHPAVLILNNVYYDTGINAQAFHNEVADYYHVPHVSVYDTIYQQMKQGIYIREELTCDGLHPNDKGHGLIADEIIKILEQIKIILDIEDENDNMAVQEAREIAARTGNDITGKTPLTKNAYQNARLLNITNVLPELSGFRADPEEKKGHLDCFKNGWIGKNKGDKIVFREECSCIAIQYRKTIHRPAPIARVVLDGDTGQEVILDGNFGENWGDCLYLEPVLNHGARKRYTIEIEIVEVPAGNQIPFYLAALILA